MASDQKPDTGNTAAYRRAVSRRITLGSVSRNSALYRRLRGIYAVDRELRINLSEYPPHGN